MISMNATIDFDNENNAIHIIEGGRVVTKVEESPTLEVEGDLMYSGMRYL